MIEFKYRPLKWTGDVRCQKAQDAAGGEYTVKLMDDSDRYIAMAKFGTEIRYYDNIEDECTGRGWCEMIYTQRIFSIIQKSVSGVYVVEEMCG